jgi:hypothetical protein
MANKRVFLAFVILASCNIEYDSSSGLKVHSFQSTINLLNGKVLSLIALGTINMPLLLSICSTTLAAMLRLHLLLSLTLTNKAFFQLDLISPV